MENQIVLNDSISTIQQTLEIVAPIHEKSFSDIMLAIATIVIALANLFLVIYIFRKNNKKADDNNEKNRKINLLKTLVLDYNMKYFYQFFDEIKTETNKLQQVLSDDAKSVINETLKDSAIDLRQKFTDVLLAINKTLYEEILKATDSLIDGITNDIFDDGVNLSHKPKFDELVTKKIFESKTKIIKILFNYSGV